MSQVWISPDGKWRTAMFKCNSFPQLDTYEKAEAHEAQVKPMRGSWVKPIHLRSRKHMQIMRLDNNDIVYVDSWGSAHEPETDYIVKWKPNGEIYISAPMYNCVYEQLSSLFGIRFKREANKLWVERHNGFMGWLPLHDRYSEYVSVFKLVGGVLSYINPPRLTQKAVDRGVAKAVRAKYKRIYDYIKNVVKLRDDDVYPLTEFINTFNIELTEDEKIERRGAYWAVRQVVPKVSLGFPLAQQDKVVEIVSLANEGDLEMSRKLWLACAYANGSANVWGNGDITCTPKQIVKAFDNFILRLHREEVFYDKELPTGKTQSTANEKFFR